MKRILENFQISMVSEEVGRVGGGWGGYMKHAVSGYHFSRFPKRSYFSSFLAFKSSFGKYMLPLNGTQNFRVIDNFFY